MNHVNAWCRPQGSIAACIVRMLRVAMKPIAVAVMPIVYKYDAASRFKSESCSKVNSGRKKCQ